MNEVLAVRLFRFADLHADQIAREWWRSVTTNPRTASYRDVPEREILPHAVAFYKHLKKWYDSERLYDDLTVYANSYADEMRGRGIPLCEAVYALVMMRRQMWLSAEFQELFTNEVGLYQAIESANRAVLITDYLSYIIASRYEG